MKLFNNDTAISFFKHSDAILGYSSNEAVNLTLPDKRTVGLFEYLDLMSMTSTRLHLYILTTTKPEFRNPISDDEDKEEDEDANEQPAKKLLNKKDNEETPLFFEKREDPPTVSKILNAYNQNENSEAFLNQSCTQETNMLNVNKKLKLHIENCNHINKTQNNIIEVKSIRHGCSTMINTDYILIDDSFNYVKVAYFDLVFSSYSEELSVCDTDKGGLFYKILEESNLENQQEFEPVSYGYEINNLTLNGETLLRVEVQQDHSKKYEFLEFCPVKPHEIIHDIDIVNGYSTEGQFGIGIITKCTVNCKPLCSWFCDGNMYKQDYMLFWLSDFPENKINGVWQCKIKCTQSSEKLSKKVKFINQSPSLNMHSNIATNIDREEFHYDDKDVIGTGSQGTVYKGVYRYQEIAIKVIKTYGINPKAIDKEIEIMKCVNHKNFIKIVGVCKQNKTVFILMELFPSKPLADVILGDLKQYCQLDVFSKIKMIVEICKAFCFLHMQENSIIHRDVKLDNILMDTDGRIKICDFGISTITYNITALRTTNSSNALGTFMYQAPELLIEEKPATTMTEIWALGVVITEIFLEECAWDVYKKDDLKKKLQDKVIPNIFLLPTELKSTIASCFSYDPYYRPTIFQLLQEIRSKCTLYYSSELLKNSEISPVPKE